MKYQRSWLVALALAVAFSGRAAADVPAEVPSPQTTQIYSPFHFYYPDTGGFGDSGESVFDDGGSVFGLGYPVANELEASLPPTDLIWPAGDFGRFTNFLESPAGILFIATHGAADGELLIEAYPADDYGKSLAQHSAKAQQKLWSLPDGAIGVNNVEATFGGPAYNGVVIYQGFFTAPTIAAVLACSGSANLGHFATDT